MTNPRSSTTLSTPQGLANPSSLAAAVTPLPLTSAPAPAPAPASAPPPPPPPPPFVGAWVDLSVPPPPPPIPSLRDWATDYYGRVLYEHVLAVSQDREPTPELFVCVFVETWAMMAALDPVGAAWFAEWCELNRHPTW